MYVYMYMQMYVYYITLYHIILYYIISYCIILNNIVVYYITSYYIILYYIILHYIILYYIILYYILLLYYIIMYSALPCTRAQKACILPIVPKLASKSSMTPRPCSSLPPKNDEAPEWFHDPWPVPGHWHTYATYAAADVTEFTAAVYIQMEHTYLYI